MIFDAKFSKRFDVMYVQLPAKFRFSLTAPLAGVVVAASSVAPLGAPVGAVVRKHTAFPSGISCTSQYRELVLLGVQLLPFRFALDVTEYALITGEHVRLNFERLTALFAYAVNAFVRWMILSIPVFAQPFAKTGRRTESATRAVVFCDLFTALFAGARCYQYNTELTCNVSLSGTLAGTIDARPARVIPELLAACRACCSDAFGSHLASARTVSASILRRGRIRERLTALRAFFGKFQLVFSPVCV